jgi:hypothetical protein
VRRSCPCGTLSESRRLAEVRLGPRISYKLLTIAWEILCLVTTNETQECLCLEGGAMEGRSALTGLVYPLVFLCLLLLVRLSEVEARSPDPNPGGTADSILSSNLGVAVAAAIAGAIVGGVLAGIVAWPQIRAARAQENIARDALKEARRQADTAEDALKEAKRQADTAEDALAEARRAAETTRREAQREAAVTYLRTVASSLEGMARLLSVKEVPRVDGHAFEFMIQSFETTLTPYLGDEARRHASR